MERIARRSIAAGAALVALTSLARAEDYSVKLDGRQLPYVDVSSYGNVVRYRFDNPGEGTYRLEAWSRGTRYTVTFDAARDTAKIAMDGKVGPRSSPELPLRGAVKRGDVVELYLSCNEDGYVLAQLVDVTNQQWGGSVLREQVCTFMGHTATMDGKEVLLR